MTLSWSNLQTYRTEWSRLKRVTPTGSITCGHDPEPFLSITNIGTVDTHDGSHRYTNVSSEPVSSHTWFPLLRDTKQTWGGIFRYMCEETLDNYILLSSLPVCFLFLVPVFRYPHDLHHVVFAQTMMDTVIPSGPWMYLSIVGGAIPSLGSLSTIPIFWATQKLSLWSPFYGVTLDRTKVTFQTCVHLTLTWSKDMWVH